MQDSLHNFSKMLCRCRGHQHKQVCIINPYPKIWILRNKKKNSGYYYFNNTCYRISAPTLQDDSWASIYRRTTMEYIPGGSSFSLMWFAVVLKQKKNPNISLSIKIACIDALYNPFRFDATTVHLFSDLQTVIYFHKSQKYRHKYVKKIFFLVTINHSVNHGMTKL